MKCILIWQICKNMMVPRCLAAASGRGSDSDGWHWVQPWRLAGCEGNSALAPSVAEAMEAGFLPALDEDQANMLPQRSCALGPQVTNPGYPGLSQFIWWYPWLTPDIKSYPVFRWTVEVRRGVTRPAAAARQPGAEMNETFAMSTSEGISRDNSVKNYHPDLSRVIQVWPSYPKLSRDMQV